MKSLIIYLVLGISGIEAASCQADIYDSLFISPDWRGYNVHLPQGYAPSVKYPLILGFHGGQQAGKTDIGWQALPLLSKLSEKADKEGFIVVYPEGKEFITGRSWNAGACCPPSSSKAVDDVAFVNSLLNKLFTRYSVDTTRVYATGTSNGAMFCYRLACELSHRIAAIAPNAASHMLQPCNPVNRVPIISFNSKIDPVVPYGGGFGPSTVPFLKDVYFPGQDSNLCIWARMDTCLQREMVVNGQNKNYDFIKLSNCKCPKEIHHYATTDGGHSWPGGNPNDISPASQQINATDLLWDFFKNYTLGCAGRTAVSEPPAAPMAVYPNPARDAVYINMKKAGMRYRLYTPAGTCVMEGIAEDKIEVARLASGVYLLFLEYPGNRQVFNIFKE